MSNNIIAEEVVLGNEKYDFIRNKNGKEYLKKIENVGNQKISVILKTKGQENSKDIEKYIIDVLSDLYIQKNVKKLLENFFSN